MPVTYYKNRRPTDEQWSNAIASVESEKKWEIAAESAGASAAELVQLCTSLALSRLRDWPIQDAIVLAQEVTTYAVERFKPNRMPFMGFFRIVLKGVIIDVQREQIREKIALERLAALQRQRALETDTPDPDAETEALLRQQAVQNVLAKAKPVDRYIFERRFAGSSFQEVLDAPDFPWPGFGIVRARVRMHRLYRRIKKEYWALKNAHTRENDDNEEITPE